MKALFLMSLLLLFTSAVHAQVQPYGMDKWWITSVAAEQSDVLTSWSGATVNQLYAATSTDGLFQANASRMPAEWTPIGPFRNATIDIPVIGVQHWGAGPRDGLHVFASVRNRDGAFDSAVLLRSEYTPFITDPPVWERADSGMTGKDSAQVIYSLASYYFTGHTPPQPVLAGTGNGCWQGGAGGVYWTASVFNDALADKLNSIDVTPKWFGTHAWAAGRSGVMPAAFRSNDQGQNWKTLRLPALIEGEASAVAIAPGAIDTVYVALNNTVQRSMDGGVTWTTCLFAPNVRLTALACDPENPSHVYAGGGPVFLLKRSTDYGATWESIAPVSNTVAGVTCMTVAIMDTLPMGRLPREGLFIGTAGTGVWVFDMMLGQTAAAALPAAQDPSLRIWPNPARDAVTVEFNPRGSGTIHIDVLDMLGRVATSTTRYAEALGSIQITTDLSTLRPGSYILRCSNGSSIRHSSLLVLK